MGAISMRTWVIVAAGGALGTIARHGINIWASHRFETSVPLATGIVNLIGCSAVGLLAGFIISGRLTMSAPVRTFVFVGVLGVFTTFSSFGLDTITLLRGGRTGLAAANVLVQVGLGLVAVFVGLEAGAAR